MQGVRLWKPPYGRITAIDLNTGDDRWMTRAGDLAQSNRVLQELGLHLPRTTRTPSPLVDEDAVHRGAGGRQADSGSTLVRGPSV